MSERQYQRLLAIDTSSKRLRLGLSFGDDRLIKSDEPVAQSHGELLLKKVGELFQSAGTGPDTLEGIVVNIGPGSFTGLRIGLAAAKGMAVSLGIDIIGVSLFEVAAHKLRHEDEQTVVLVPLRRGEWVVGRVVGGEHRSEHLTVATDDQVEDVVGNMAVVGYHFELASRFPALAKRDLSARAEFDAGDLIEIGRGKLQQGTRDDLALLEPLYIQKSQAEINFDLRNKK